MAKRNDWIKYTIVERNLANRITSVKSNSLYLYVYFYSDIFCSKLIGIAPPRYFFEKGVLYINKDDLSVVKQMSETKALNLVFLWSLKRKLDVIIEHASNILSNNPDYKSEDVVYIFFELDKFTKLLRNYLLPAMLKNVTYILDKKLSKTHTSKQILELANLLFIPHTSTYSSELYNQRRSADPKIHKILSIIGFSADKIVNYNINTKRQIALNNKAKAHDEINKYLDKVDLEFLDYYLNLIDFFQQFLEREDYYSLRLFDKVKFILKKCNATNFEDVVKFVKIYEASMMPISIFKNKQKSGAEVIFNNAQNDFQELSKLAVISSLTNIVGRPFKFVDDFCFAVSKQDLVKLNRINITENFKDLKKLQFEINEGLDSKSFLQLLDISCKYFSHYFAISKNSDFYFDVAICKYTSRVLIDLKSLPLELSFSKNKDVYLQDLKFLKNIEYIIQTKNQYWDKICKAIENRILKFNGRTYYLKTLDFDILSILEGNLMGYFVIANKSQKVLVVDKEMLDFLRGFKTSQLLEYRSNEYQNLAIKLFNYGFLKCNSFWMPFIKPNKGLLVLETTKNCNLTCRYCYNYKENIKLSVSDFKIIDNFLFSGLFDSYSIEFHGGEPLCNFGFIKKAVEHYKSFENKYNIKLNFMVQSNGTLMTTKKINWFNRHDVGIGFSLDGPYEINNLTRPMSKNLFAKIIKALHNQHGGAHVLCNINRKNYLYIEKIIEFMAENNVNTLRLNYCFLGNSASNYSITPLEFFDVVKKAQNIITKKYFGKIKLRNIIEIIDVINNKRNFCYFDPCLGGINMFVIVPPNIYSCPELIGFIPIGDVKNRFCLTDNIHNLQNHKTSCVEKCNFCNLKYICSGGCIAKNYRDKGCLTGINNYCEYYDKLIKFVLEHCMIN